MGYAGVNNITRVFVLTSTDGISWSVPTPVADGSSSRLAYGGGWFVLTGSYYNNDHYEHPLWISTNLNSWQLLTTFTNVWGNCYGEGTFVLVGNNQIYQSDFLEPVAPSIGSHPKSTAVYEGGNATFKVTAFGSPPLDYQWRKGMTPIPNATNTTLTLTNVLLADAGQYDVVVTNSVGSVTSQTATLAVSWLSIGRFTGLYLSGTVGDTINIEVLDSVADTNWMPLTNIVLPSSPYIWIDYDSPNHPARFYRAARP